MDMPRSAHDSPHPACQNCGYDLTGVVGRTQCCPECGNILMRHGYVMRGVDDGRTRRRVVAAIVFATVGLIVTIIVMALIRAAEFTPPMPTIVPSPVGPAPPPFVRKATAVTPHTATGVTLDPSFPPGSTDFWDMEHQKGTPQRDW